MFLDRICELLAPALADGGVMIDATVGLAGHTTAVLERFPGARVVGIDRDPEALRLARQRTSAHPGRFVGHAAVFDDIEGALAAVEADTADAVLFDLGVSSLQLDSDRRGSLTVGTPNPGPEDGRHGRVTAADVVNEYSTEELTRVFRESTAKSGSRTVSPVLRRRCPRSVPTYDHSTGGVVRQRGAPGRSAQRPPGQLVFQALRIEVNDELGHCGSAGPGGAGHQGRWPGGPCCPTTRSGGPDRQACLRCGDPATGPARTAHHPGHRSPLPAAADPRRRSRPPPDRRQLGGVCPTAGRGEDPAGHPRLGGGRMTTATPPGPTPLPDSVPRVARSRLRPRVSSLPFLALIAGLLGAALIALLLINNSLAAGSFEQARLKGDQILLGNRSRR